MMMQVEVEPLMQVARVQPEDVRSKARSLRQQSRQCSDLAETSVTADAQQVLAARAQELHREADQIEHALLTIGRLYGGTSASEAGEPIES
jgi:hypothetical protein